MSLHQKRTENEIKRKISRIIDLELNDPRLGLVTITDVSLSGDLRVAKIFFTVLEKGNLDNSLVILNNAKKHIRWLLAKEVRFRTVPEINFYPWKN